MRVTTALLLYTVYFTHSASAAGSSDRRGIVGRRSQPFYPSSNDTLSSSFSSTVPPSAPAPADAAALSSSSFSSASSHSSIGFNSSSLAMSRLPSLSSSSSPLHSTPSPPSRASSTNSISPASTQPSATITITTSHTPLYGPAVPIQSECPPNVDASGCTTAPTDDDGATIDYTAGVPTSNGDCMSIDDPDKPMTQFSVVYTSTVTFYGNRSEYIPPFEPLVTPTYCTPALGPAFPFSSGLDEMPPSDIPMGPISVEASGRHANLPVITFITTDKNPSVVVPSDPVPRYSPTSIPGGRGGEDYGSGNHKTAADVGDPGGGSHLIPDAESVSNGPRSSFVITARADDVVINEQTYSDLGPSQTTAVTVSGATFTISPTAVVGEGTVIEKPAPVGAIVSMAMPTSGKVGGLPVTLTGSEAIVGGSSAAFSSARQIRPWTSQSVQARGMSGGIQV